MMQSTEHRMRNDARPTFPKPVAVFFPQHPQVWEVNLTKYNSGSKLILTGSTLCLQCTIAHLAAQIPDIYTGYSIFGSQLPGD